MGSYRAVTRALPRVGPPGRRWLAALAAALVGVALAGCQVSEYDPTKEAVGTVQSFLVDCGRDEQTLIPAMLTEDAHREFAKASTTLDACNRVVPLGRYSYAHPDALGTLPVTFIGSRNSDSATVRIAFPNGGAVVVPLQYYLSDWHIALPGAPGPITRPPGTTTPLGQG